MPLLTSRYILSSFFIYMSLYFFIELNILHQFSSVDNTIHASRYQNLSIHNVNQVATPTPTLFQSSTITPTTQLLQMEKLQQEIEHLRFTNTSSSRQLDSLGKFSTALVALALGVFGILQWLGNRREDRMKRAEESFQAVAEGLGSDIPGVRAMSAVTLRTFLGRGYKKFYTQVFNLAVAGLRIEEKNPDNNLLSYSTPVKGALVFVIKQSYPLARRIHWWSTTKSALFSAIKQYCPPTRRLYWPAAPELLDARYVSLFDTNLEEVNFKRIRMKDADLRSASLRDANLEGARLERSKFRDAILEGVNFKDADLRSTTIDHARAKNANFTRAQLERVDFTETQLMNAKFKKAQLDEAVFINAKLKNAVFDGADLRKAVFNGADLTEATFTDADLSGANPEKAETLVGTIMKGVKGLTNEQVAICKLKGATFD